MQINGKRLMENLFELGKIGENEKGGIDRAFGSESDLEAREWLKDYWRKHTGIEAEVDPIANLWVKYNREKELPAIVIGSHHDAVPDGGKYDGAMGVLMATEVLQTIQENKISLRHPLTVVSFTGEEPNPFNVSTLGSKVICGRLKRENLNLFNRLNGESLKSAIDKAGGEIEQVKDALLSAKEIGAFIECHIEQGDRLEAKKRPLATVSCITGIYREMYTVVGEANHAGTTVMTNRRDAFLGVAELSLKLNEIVKSFNDNDIVATVGYVKVEPNEANIIPGQAQCIVDIRTYSPKIKEKIIEKIKEAVRQVEVNQKVQIQREVILDQQHMPMHPLVMQKIAQGIEMIGEKNIELVSMAGHDAANIARFTKAGMLFVQSKDGKSHCREEYSKPEDIIKAANTMLQAVLLLDEEEL